MKRTNNIINVVAAIIVRDDRIFATQRGYGDWKDWWEFPGGKIEPGESPDQALLREIREELDTEIRIENHLTDVEYDYPSFHLSMRCYICSIVSGELELKEHEAAKWLKSDELDSVNWLPADKSIIEILKNERQLLTYDIAPEVQAFSPMRGAVLPFPVVQAHQVHSDKVAVIRSGDETRDDLEGIDAMITNVPGIAIGARTADCVPVLLYDPVNKAIAAVHAGWKGTVLKISAKALEAMKSEFGTDNKDVLAVIGPSIGPDSFQVKEDVVSIFRNAGFPEEWIIENRGEFHINLWKANEWILTRTGVQKDNIQIAGIDTYTDPRFFSARREGIQCGRIINTIMLKADKKAVRAFIKRQIKALTPSERERLSNEAKKRVIESSQWKSARRIMLFLSLPDEIDTAPLVIEALRDSKEIYVPKVNGSDIDIYRYSPDGMNSGAFGITEPDSESCERLEDNSSLDLIIVPGLAFTTEGKRLGRGKGFYDRFLANADPQHEKSYGFCYPFQILREIPVDPWDQELTGIL